MNDITMQLECSGREYIIHDFDWFRLQGHILKHIVHRDSQEKWKDIFLEQEILKIWQDLENKKCKGIDKPFGDINIGICIGCGQCEKDSLHIEFREKLHGYIKSALQKDKDKKTSSHAHGKEEYICVSCEGVSIKMKVDKGFSFRTVFMEIKNDERYFNATTPSNRCQILKSIALQDALHKKKMVHYSDNFKEVSHGTQRQS